MNMKLLAVGTSPYIYHIEAFFDRWDQLIICGLENGGKTSADHVGQLFKVRKNGWLMKRQEKCCQSLKHLALTKMLQTQLNLLQKLTNLSNSIAAKF